MNERLEKLKVGSPEWMKEQLESDQQRIVVGVAEAKAQIYPYWNALSLIITAYLAGASK